MHSCGSITPRAWPALRDRRVGSRYCTQAAEQTARLDTTPLGAVGDVLHVARGSVPIHVGARTSLALNLKAQYSQHNSADPDYERRKRDGIIFQPVPALHTHDNPQLPGGYPGSASLRSGGSRSFRQHFNCVSWAWFCASCREDAHAVERAQDRSLEPPDGDVAYTVGPRDIRLRLARSKPLDRLLALVGTQLRRTTKFHSTGLRSLPAITRAGTDQLALKLGNTGEHRNQQPTMCCRGVRPGIG
jgi:hypothetical protein